MTVVNELRSSGKVQTTTRAVLLTALALGAAWSAVDAVGASVAIVTGALRHEVATALVTDAPVAVAHTGGLLTSAVYDSASVVVSGAPTGIHAVALVAQGSSVVTRLALGLAFVLLIVAVLRRAPFSSGTALRITLCGAIAMISALLALGTGVLADWMIAGLLDDAGAGRWPIAAAGDPALIPLGFALMIVGLLISHGAQLQRATDGLV